MAKISESDLYDFHDLTAIRKSGWRELAKFCTELGFGGDEEDEEDEGDSIEYVTLDESIYNFAESVFLKVMKEQKVRLPINFSSLLALAFATDEEYKKKRFHSNLWLVCELSSPSPRFRKSLNKVLNALCASHTCGDATGKFASTANYKKFKKSLTKEEIECFEKLRIDQPWAPAFAWVQRSLNREVSEEEAWWNCAWIFTEFEMSKLLEIKKLVSENVPPTDEQIDYLNEYIKYGHPRGTRVIDSDGKVVYEIGLQLEREHIYFLSFADAALTMLTQPAFLLAQELQKHCSKPRFIRQCRAPSCGKTFYTGWKHATACPSKQSDHKSACALEWVRYTRYLQKIGKNPENDWNDKQLKKDFISYDKT